MDKRKKTPSYIKAINDTIKLPTKQGNGILKYSVSVDSKGRIVRYSLAYMNYNICHVDNGRVLGFDNCHGYHHHHHHHRHRMGKEEKINFTTYEELVELFESEWRKIHETVKK